MALHALPGVGRRMLVAGDAPRLEPMALRTVAAEPLRMRVLPVVASGTVEGLAGRDRIESIGAPDAKPRLQRCEGCSTVAVPSRTCIRVSTRLVRKCSCADLGEFHMVHFERSDTRGLMFDVTRCTLLDARVERGRLTAGNR